MTAVNERALGVRCSGPEGVNSNPNTQEGEAVMTSMSDQIKAPVWAHGADIHDEGKPEEFRCHWTLPVPVGGVLTYEHVGDRNAHVFAEQTTFGSTPKFEGPFVVLEIVTDSSERALLTPAVARRLATALLNHAQMLDQDGEIR